MHICMLTYVWVHSYEGQRVMFLSSPVILCLIYQGRIVSWWTQSSPIWPVYLISLPHRDLFSPTLWAFKCMLVDLNSALPICMTISPQPLLNKMYDIELSKRKQLPKSPPATSLLTSYCFLCQDDRVIPKCFVHSELSYKQCQYVFFPSRVCRKGKYFFHPTLTPQSSWGVFSISGWLIINWIFYIESQEATFYEGQKMIKTRPVCKINPVGVWMGKGGGTGMPLTVVISSLCSCNDLSIKVLSERVWPLHYKGKKSDFFSQLSYAFHSLMTLFSQLPHGIVGPFH